MRHVPISASRLRELESCKGANPIPEDFDEFWAKRMAEADAVDLDYEIVPSKIPTFDTCTYYDLWFTGMGGARVYAKYVVPATEGKHPLVLQFHGYPGCTRSWAEQSSFPGMGCAILSMDNPGQGGRSEDVGGFKGTPVSGHLIAGLDGGPENLYYVRLYQDQRILCRIARELDGVDLSRVFVNGSSQGGGMGLACCALNSDLINRASILYPFLECFHTLGYIDTLSFAHLVRCPVLFGTGLADVVCPPETQFAVYNALTCPKRHVLFPDFGHEEIQAYDDMIIGFYQGEVDF